MKHLYLTEAAGFALSLLFTACSPVPVPNVPTSAPVAIETPPSPTLASTSTPTSLPTLTPTPLPLPCSGGFFTCVFFQAAGGRTFEVRDGANVNLTIEELSKECGFTSEYGVRLTYSVPNEETNNVSWGIEWKSTQPGKFDASNFTNFTFAVRGESGGETFLIGMKDILRDEDIVTLESKSYVIVSSSVWEKVTIPIDHFSYQTIKIDPFYLENVSFNFDERHGSGSICIDDIAFTE